MTQIAAREYYVALDVSKDDDLVNQSTGQAPKHWGGNPAAFKLGLFAAESIVTDVSNIESISAQLKDNAGTGSTRVPPDDDAPVLATASIVNASLSQPTLEEWNARTLQHGTISLTGGQLAREKGFYWLVFVATVTGVTDPVTLGAGWIEIVEDGFGDPGDPLVGETFLTATQSEARFMNRTPAAQPATEAASGTALDWHWDATNKKLSLCVGNNEWIEIRNVVTKFTNS